MTTSRRVRYVLTEVLAGAAELHARWQRRARDQTSRLLVRPRPQLDPGDEVTVQLSLAHAPTLALEGRVALSIAPRAAPGLCAVALGTEATRRIGALLAQARSMGDPARRSDARRPLELWGECRRSRRDVVRMARILDASEDGLFLASGLECRPGETVLFRPERAQEWLAGAVRWCGEKAGESGVGVSLTFSRTDERERWLAWVQGRGAAVAG